MPPTPFPFGHWWLQIIKAHLGVVLDSEASSARITVPADVLREAVLVLGQVVGASVVWDPVLEDVLVGTRGVAPTAAAILQCKKNRMHNQCTCFLCHFC